MADYRVSIRGKLPEGIFSRIAALHATAIAEGPGRVEDGAPRAEVGPKAMAVGRAPDAPRSKKQAEKA